VGQPTADIKLRSIYFLAPSWVPPFGSQRISAPLFAISLRLGVVWFGLVRLGMAWGGRLWPLAIQVFFLAGFFPHLAAAAFLAISLRRVAVSDFALAGPPFFPMADAAWLIAFLSRVSSVSFSSLAISY